MAHAEAGVVQHCGPRQRRMGVEALWMFAKVKMRGGFLFDLNHRRNNNIIDAYKRSGMWYVQLEYMLVANFVFGPFGKNANWNTVSEAGRECLLSLDHKNELYNLLYEYIALDLNGGTAPHGFGTSEHMERLWLDLRVSLCLVPCLDFRAGLSPLLEQVDLRNDFRIWRGPIRLSAFALALSLGFLAGQGRAYRHAFGTDGYMQQWGLFGRPEGCGRIAVPLSP